MIETTACKTQTGQYILKLQVRKIFENLLWRQTVCQKIQYISDPNTQTADTRAAATLFGIDSYSV